MLLKYKAQDAGLTTVYYHLMITTLDLSIISNAITYKLSANITSLQVYEPSDLDIDSYYTEFNFRRKSEGKLALNYNPVVDLFCSFLNDTYL